MSTGRSAGGGSTVLVALCVALSGCFRPVGDTAQDASCAEKTFAFPIPVGSDAWYSREFLPVDAGLLGPMLIVINPEDGEHWAVRSDREFMMFDYLPTWFHPDGYRSLIWAGRPQSGFWQLDLDNSLKASRSTLLVRTTDAEAAFWSGPSRVSARRLDVCVVSRAGDGHILTLDDRGVVRRGLPPGIRRCVDALELSANTWFVVEIGDGGQALLRVSPTSVELLSELPPGLCRLATRADAGPMLWCAQGRRLSLADAFDGSVVYESEADSDINSLSVFLGLEGAVVTGEVASPGRFTLMDVAGKRREVEVLPWLEPMFGRLNDGRVVLGGMMQDGGFEMRRFCW